jgi:hypothetical protein
MSLPSGVHATGCAVHLPFPQGEQPLRSVESDLFVGDVQVETLWCCALSRFACRKVSVEQINVKPGAVETCTSCPASPYGELSLRAIILLSASRGAR